MPPKDIAMLALGKLKKSPDEGAPEGGEDEGLMTAMEDLLSAISAKDAAGMASAFRSACEMCEGGGSYPEDDQGPPQ